MKGSHSRRALWRVPLLLGSAVVAVAGLTGCRRPEEKIVPYVTAPETEPNFSAVAYHFGQKLQKELGVPVGLIHVRPSGNAITVRCPLSTTVTLRSIANARAAPTRSFWIASTLDFVSRAISPGCGVRMRTSPSHASGMDARASASTNARSARACGRTTPAATAGTRWPP